MRQIFVLFLCIVHFATAKENIYDDTSELSHPFSVIRRGKLHVDSPFLWLLEFYLIVIHVIHVIHFT